MRTVRAAFVVTFRSPSHVTLACAGSTAQLGDKALDRANRKDLAQLYDAMGLAVI